MHVEMYLSAAFALIGLVVYFAATNPKYQMLGIVSYGSGLLAFLLRATGVKFGIG